MADTATMSQLVVIGSSAGGVEALMTLVSTLPADFAAPLVVAQHLDPSHPSYLQEILSRHGTLPVRTVVEQESLQRGVVYVVPANRHVQITDHSVSVSSQGEGRYKPSIDLLFQTAASVFGEGLIAVVLSGSGSDGAAGARRVKEAGGTVVIQNPRTASFPSMPGALAPTMVDVVADITALGPLLHDLLAGTYTPRAPRDGLQQSALLAEVHERSGVDFSRYEAPTIQRRLQRRLIATGTHTLGEYRAYLGEHPEEYDRLITSFLLKVSEFFGDPDLFAVLRTEVIPAVVAAAREHDNEVRIWSAGCGTGEETYSLAVLVADALGPELDDFKVRIFATDLDEEATEFARRGVYPTAAVAAVPPDLLGRYFEHHDGHVAVTKRVRSLTVFGAHDLGRWAPFPRCDMVLCRDVLVYFTPALRQRALELFAYALRGDGYLVLGNAESPDTLASSFVPLRTSPRLYRRGGERPSLPLPKSTTPLAPARPRGPVRSPRLAGEAVTGLAHQADAYNAEEVVLGLPVGVVLVDHRYDIMRINAAARRLLAIHRPALGEDLVHLVGSVPSDTLRAAVDAALGGRATELEELPTQKVVPGETRYLQISARPYPPAGEGEGPRAVLITIVDATASTVARLAALSEAARRQAEAAQLATLVEQLSAANRELLAANEELASGNLHLRRSNEEYVLGNEEIQASSEEVETLNEELQATNEELEAMNEELRARQQEMGDLAAAEEAQRRRLAGILGGMSEAVIVLDQAGNAVFANPTYTALFGPGGQGPVPVDTAGQPLPMDRWPQQRLQRGETFQMEVLLRDLAGRSRRYEVTGRPIATGEEHREGLLVLRDSADRPLSPAAAGETGQGARGRG